MNYLEPQPSEAILAREGPVNGQISALEALAIEATVRDIVQVCEARGKELGDSNYYGAVSANQLAQIIRARYGLGE